MEEDTRTSRREGGGPKGDRLFGNFGRNETISEFHEFIINRPSDLRTRPFLFFFFFFFPRLVLLGRREDSSSSLLLTLTPEEVTDLASSFRGRCPVPEINIRILGGVSSKG